MKYYVGKGTEFKKSECKEYKTIEGALKAAAKDENLVVWDETGKMVGSMTDNVPDGALTTNPDGSVNTYDADGNLTGTVSAEEAAALTGEAAGQQDSEDESQGAAGQQDSEDESQGAAGQQDAQNDTQGDAGQAQNDENGQEQTNTPPANENGQNGANSASNEQGKGNDVIIPQGTMRVTVICDGALNLRRSAAWGNGNICGRAMRGQKYHVKAIHTVAGKKMVETIDGLFLSGQSEHVAFEQL